MTTLTERALLVSLTISQWSARKYDRRESADLANRHGTSMNVARVNKNLLPCQTELEAVHKKTEAVRQLYLKHTLPWAQEGVRILKADQWFTFTTMMREQMDEWEKLVGAFVSAYPRLRSDAEQHLNGMFKAEDYPEAHNIRSKFTIDTIFTPVPRANDWRIDIGDEALDRLREEITARVVDAEAKAMQDAWKRVHDVISKAHERLSGPDNIFRDTLVENAVELCALLPGLNIAGDPALEKMRQDLEGSLCKFSPDTLRKAPDVRKDVADKMADLMARMGPMYGAR